MSSQARRVLVIGWDGADWKVASPLIDAGKMPNLQRLIETGVMGNISTLYPVLSPMLWTSIATGKRAHKHGIHGFAEPDPTGNSVRPITNLNRKCKTIWNILNQNGKKSNVVGWWPSHPVEPINGVMVSNHFQLRGNHPENKWPVRAGTVHPANKTKSLAKFRLCPRELEAEQILPFVPRAAEVDQEKDRRIFGVAKTLAETASVHAVSTAIMQHEPWDFMAVYFDAIDHFCHGYMKYHPPRPEWIPEKDFEIYQHVIDSAYCFHDMMLGATLELAGPDTTVILMSDHGFHPDQLRPQSVSNEPAGPADEHRQFGMLVINGPGIKQDDLIFGASLLDITPTILKLFDLPIGRDMDGKPLVQIFESEPEVELIDSWEEVDGDDGRHPSGMQLDPYDARESMKQLEDLGYVEKADEETAVTVRNTLRELRYNLARDLLDSNKLPAAIALLSELWSDFPDQSRFGVKLFACYLKLDDVDNAEIVFKKILVEKQKYAAKSLEELNRLREELGDTKPEDLKPPQIQKLNKLRRQASTNPHAVAFLQGSLLYAQGEFERALEILEKAEDVQTYNQPSLLQKRGDCLLGMGRFPEAATQYLAILKIDPANAQAYLGLAHSELALEKPAKAITAAKSSIGLVFHNPKAHYLLGRAQRMVRAPQRAIASFETALSQNSVFPDCLRSLADLYSQLGKADLQEKYLSMAEAAVSRIESFKQFSPLPEDADLELDVSMDEPIGIGRIEHDESELELSQTVVIVSGLPRSGTSMMMQMLQAGGLEIIGDEKRKADESNPNGYLEYEPVKHLMKDNNWLTNAKGKVVKIVAPLLPHIRGDINYRIIFMARPLSQVTASQRKMLQRLKRSGANISDRQLASTFMKQIKKVTSMLENYPNVSALTINYSDAINRSEAVAEDVNEFLGGRLDQQKMSAAVEPKLQNEKH